MEKTWGDLLERFGLSVAFLAVLLLAVWKLFWPLIVRAQAALEEQVREARVARQRDTEMFDEALKRRDTVNAEQAAALEKVVHHLDEVRNEIRRNR